jgi:hypothetical protein
MTTQTPGLGMYRPLRFLSITQLAQAARCPRRDFYHRGCGLVQPTDPLALKFGECIHAALPVLLTETLDAGIHVFETHWFPTGLEDLGDTKNCAGMARQMLTDFYRSQLRHPRLYEIIKPPRTFPIDGPVSEYELPLAFTLDGLSVPILSRADGLCRLCSTGETFVLEYKTAHSIATQFFSAFELNNQVLGYTLGARATLQRDDIMGAVVVGLAKTKEPKTIAMPYRVQDFQLAEWSQMTVEIGNRILASEQAGHFPKWFTGCNQVNSFGVPGYNCDYIGLCSVPDWTTQRGLFVQRFHEPFKIVGDKP